MRFVCNGFWDDHASIANSSPAKQTKKPQCWSPIRLLRERESLIDPALSGPWCAPLSANRGCEPQVHITAQPYFVFRGRAPPRIGDALTKNVVSGG